MAHWPSGSFLMASCLIAHSAAASFEVVSIDAPAGAGGAGLADVAAGTAAGAGAAFWDVVPTVPSLFLHPSETMPPRINVQRNTWRNCLIVFPPLLLELTSLYSRRPSDRLLRRAFYVPKNELETGGAVAGAGRRFRDLRGGPWVLGGVFP